MLDAHGGQYVFDVTIPRRCIVGKEVGQPHRLAADHRLPGQTVLGVQTFGVGLHDRLGDVQRLRNVQTAAGQACDHKTLCERGMGPEKVQKMTTGYGFSCHGGHVKFSLRAFRRR